jgi:hypothetical protein
MQMVAYLSGAIFVVDDLEAGRQLLPYVRNELE